MAHGESSRRTARRIPAILLVALLVVIAASAAATGYRSLSPTTTPPPIDDLGAGLGGSPSTTAASPGSVLRGDHLEFRGEHDAALGEADGAVPNGTTVFDDEIPGVANLDPDLLGALRQAATDVADEAIEFLVDSGWRSPEYQSQLLRDAVSEYGSEAEAARWVATPTTSAHVSGDAVDIGPVDATAWLSQHGSTYGLCQIYGNEPWHYELRPGAINHGCPRMYADPSRDPRMRG